MRNISTLLLSVLISVAAFGSPLFAQEEQQAPPSGTIHIEQSSDVGAVGVWSVILPNHETLKRTDAILDMPNMMPGQYTFVSTPPKGTSTHIDVYLGDDIVKSSDIQQISFDLRATETLRVVVKYTLTIFGKVGVNSDPIGVAFNLQGPDGLVINGVTPAEFFPQPIGNYSVTYSPGGCPQPSAKSGVLTKDGRLDLMIEIVCATFVPVQPKEGPKNVITDIGGRTFTFTDVPSEAWFAPYVATITNRGIMLGYTDDQGKSTGLFGPGDPVTIAQLAKIAHSVIKLNQNDVMTAPINPLARGQWFTRYIASAEEQGWLVYLDGTVDPNRSATRAEVVATLLQILDIPIQWGKGNSFTDVQKKTHYSGAVETAAAEGIVSGSTNADGTPTGLFHPTDPISRAEIAKILIAVREKYQTGSSSSDQQ